ncbi:hypothetical protein BH09BAC1_BH09BAC1_15800 [soil metagenome]
MSIAEHAAFRYINCDSDTREFVFDLKKVEKAIYTFPATSSTFILSLSSKKTA